MGRIGRIGRILPCGAFCVLGGIWLGVAVKDAPNRVARVRSEAFGAGGDR